MAAAARERSRSRRATIEVGEDRFRDDDETPDRDETPDQDGQNWRDKLEELTEMVKLLQKQSLQQCQQLQRSPSRIIDHVTKHQLEVVRFLQMQQESQNQQTAKLNEMQVQIHMIARSLAPAPVLLAPAPVLPRAAEQPQQHTAEQPQQHQKWEQLAELQHQLESVRKGLAKVAGDQDSDAADAGAGLRTSLSHRDHHSEARAASGSLLPVGEQIHERGSASLSSVQSRRTVSGKPAKGPSKGMEANQPYMPKSSAKWKRG
eukprot:6492564-Amphidinium_carterae.1